MIDPAIALLRATAKKIGISVVASIFFFMD
jgi:hypothetical protein